MCLQFYYNFQIKVDVKHFQRPAGLPVLRGPALPPLQPAHTPHPLRGGELGDRGRLPPAGGRLPLLLLPLHLPHRQHHRREVAGGQAEQLVLLEGLFVSSFNNR